MAAHPDTGLKVPELPNLITLLYQRFHDQAWAKFLHEWENLFFSIFVASLIALFFYLGTRKRELVPRGIQNFLEWIAEILDALIIGILGPRGEKYFPFLATIFVYTLTMNLFGLIPLMKSPSASLNITAAQGICVFILVQFLSIRNMGVRGYMYHLAGSPKSTIEWVLVPLMFPIELITQIARPVTLALRLFGNILGEDILLGYFALVGATTLSAYYYSLGFPFQTPFMFLALLTSLMQALVFTLLTTVYILLSLPHADEKHHQ